MLGIVTDLDARGFGHIESEGARYYFHSSYVVGKAFKDLSIESRVDFHGVQDHVGQFVARNVHPLPKVPK